MWDVREKGKFVANGDTGVRSGCSGGAKGRDEGRKAIRSQVRPARGLRFPMQPGCCRRRAYGIRGGRLRVVWVRIRELPADPDYDSAGNEPSTG